MNDPRLYQEGVRIRTEMGALVATCDSVTCAAAILTRLHAHDDLVAALADLLDQLEGVGIALPGVDEGQWSGSDGLSFREARAALDQAKGGA